MPYARAISGVEIRGDAHTWWAQAEGRYMRGTRPRIGAVMSFKPHGIMRLGHVAAVRKIVDARTVLVSHANWSTIAGTRGHIEENVRVVDTSANNDWSEVQVWYSPNAALGTSRYPINGFIYPTSPRSEYDVRLAVSQLLGRPAAVLAAASVKPSAQTFPSAPTFRLSFNTLSDVAKRSQNERNVAVTPTKAKLPSAQRVAPQHKPAHTAQATIDDLLQTIPSPRSVMASN